MNLRLKDIAATILVGLAVVLLAVLLTRTAFADEQVGLSVAATNEGGCDIPDVALLYERRTDSLEVHGRVRTGGNRLCVDTVGADISIERDFGMVSVDLGYDRHGVAVHDDGLEQSFYGSVDSASASVNVDVAMFEVGYDVINEAPRAEVDFDLMGVSTNWELTKFPGNDPVLSVRASWEHELSDGWALEVNGTYTTDPNDIGDGIMWSSATGAPPALPDSVWSYGVGFTKAL